MNKKSLFIRITICLSCLGILAGGFFLSKPDSDPLPHNFVFHWIAIATSSFFIFLPVFISLIFPKAIRKERSLTRLLLISQLLLVAATAGIIAIHSHEIFERKIIFGISGACLFLYSVNVVFTFLVTKHHTKPKPKVVPATELSWITSAQTQLESLVKKAENLGEEYKGISERIIKAKAEVESLTPVNNATALKFEHQILDSIVETLSAMDKLMAGNETNLEAKVSSLENHIRQRQTLTMY